METIRHMMSSMREFNEAAVEVHVWMDQFWNGDPEDHTHRKYLHNEKGIEEGVKKFGEWARKHLELHLKDDRE